MELYNKNPQKTRFSLFYVLPDVILKVFSFDKKEYGGKGYVGVPLALLTTYLHNQELKPLGSSNASGYAFVHNPVTWILLH